MDFQLWPAWLYPDAQPGDWYGWTVVAAGHFLLGAVAFAALYLALGGVWARRVALTGYLAIEAVQYLFLGGRLIDGVTDAAFVVGGMVLVDEAILREVRGVLIVLVGLTIPLAVGVALRL